MPENPVAAPYLDTIRGAVAVARSWLVQDDIGGGPDIIPGTFHSYDQIPPEIVESLINLETGGTWNPNLVNPSSGATGLGQFLPDGSQELAWYEELSDNDITRDDLTNPRTSINLVAFGLGARMSQVGSESWYDAGMAYFGCLGPDGKIDRSRSDGNTSCQQYGQTLYDYIEKWYGKNTAEDIGDVPGVDVTERARDAVSDIGGIFSTIIGAWPKILAISISTILIVIGIIRLAELQ